MCCAKISVLDTIFFANVTSVESCLVCHCLYLQVVVVFYVAIVLLLIGTNLRASRATATTGAERRAGRYRKHVVDYRNDDESGYFSPEEA